MDLAINSFDSPAAGLARWELLGPGAALVGYGWFFEGDLGWAAYGVIGLGVFVAAVGGSVYGWARNGMDRWLDRCDAPPQPLPPELALARAWWRFWWSLSGMFALGAFSLWRVQVTVWRPVAERYYFFPAGTWLGRLEHSWLNDALYAFGMVGILYVLYMLKEFAGSWSGQSPGVGLRVADAGLTEERWIEHQDRSKLMIGTGIVIILVWAWLEEVADLVPGYIFDKWDITAIYLGFILGYSMMQHLPYPDFGARPPFYLGPVRRRRWLGDGTRLVYVAFVWAYTSFTDPSTYADRFSHIAELAVIILGSMWVLDASRRPILSPVPPVAL
jgi:hypothetical protein